MKQPTTNVIICPNSKYLPLENSAKQNNAKLNQELRKIKKNGGKRRRNRRRCKPRKKKKGKCDTKKNKRNKKTKRIITRTIIKSDKRKKDNKEA